MASSPAKAARNHEARARLEAALAAVSARLGIAVPPEPKRAKDPGLQPIRQIERFADFAESVLAALPEASNPTVDAIQPRGEATGAETTPKTLPAAPRRSRGGNR